MPYNVLLLLAWLNVFLLYITRSFTAIPIPGHPQLEMAIALIILFAVYLRAAIARKRLDPHCVILLAFCLIALFFSFVFFHRVGSDGREYYVQLRSLVMDQDLDFRNDYAIFPGRGTAAIYAFGPALLWSPFYLAAHLMLTFLGNASPFTNVGNGITSGHQAAVAFAAFFYGAISLFLIHDIVRQYQTKTVALVAVIVLTSASFAAWYWIYEYYMPHTISLFATTLFLYLWHRWRLQSKTPKQWTALGIAAGLMAMGRWQDVAFGIVLAIDELPKYYRYLRRHNWGLFGETFSKHMLFLGAAILTFLPQMLFWKFTSGSLFAPPAEQHQVHWSRTDLDQVLWSYNHGLFTWTPVILLSLLGLLFFVRRQPRLAIVLILCFIAELYINSTVANWWAGSGFGARRFLSCLLIFVLGFSELIRVLQKRPMVAIGAICAWLAIFNIAFMLRVGAGQLPSGANIPPNQMIGDTIDEIRKATGISATFPISTLFGLKHNVLPGRFDDLEGMQRLPFWELDLGAEHDAELLGYGWSDPETKSDGTNFRWSDGPESTLLVSLALAADFDLSFRAIPFRYPGAPQQNIAISVNDRYVTAIQIPNDGGELVARIGSEYFRPGINEIRFVYGYTAVPRDLGLSDDQRRLAVMFDWIKAERINK